MLSKATAYKYLPAAASLIVVGIGCLVLIGWLFDLPSLQYVLSSLPKMTANTAVSFILAALSLLLYSTAAGHGRQRRLAQALAVLVALIGLLTLSEYLFGWDVGLDQLLFQDQAGAAETSIPGRPSPHTAVTLTLVGLSLILVHGDSPRRHWLAQYFTLTGAFIALLALVGYAFSVSFFFRISAYTGMALHTTVAFIVLTIGLLFLHPDRSFMALVTADSLGGVMTRRLLLFAIGVPLLVGWVSLLGEQAGLYTAEFKPVLLTVLSAYIFSGAILWVAHSLNRTEADRIQMEETLRQNEGQFRLVVEVSPNAIILVNPDGQINLVNAQAETLFGYSREELLGQSVEVLVSPQVHAHHNDYRDSFFNAPTARPMGAGRDLFGLRKDGRQVPVEIGLNPITTAEGSFVLASIIDITGRKQAEAEIAESLRREQAARVEAEISQQRLAFLVEASHTLASSLDYNKTLTAVAQLAVSRIADWCAVDVLEADGSLGRVAVVHTDPAKVTLAYELQRRYPPDPDAPRGVYHVLRTGQAQFYPEIPEALLEAASLNEEQLNLIRDLGLVSAIIMPMLVRDRAIGVITFVAAESGRHYSEADLALTQELAGRAALAVDNARLYQDAQKLNEELEQRVIERTTQLEAANKELEAFSYSVSHDLRAPLRSIDGFSQALMEDYADSLQDEAQHYLQRVRAASQRMAELIDDLLALSRLTRSEIRPKTISLSALIETIAAGLHQAQPERQVEFVIATDVTARADAQLIRVALENLLGNAWKFTAKHPHACIEFGVLPPTGGQLVYFVRDDGAGFDMAYADKLFGTFQRLHTPAEFSGTGIGLATVQRVIHRHGGRIWAEGAVEQGATFYFTLTSH